MLRASNKMSRGVLITCIPADPRESSVASGLLFGDNLVLTIGTLLEPFLADVPPHTVVTRASAAEYSVVLEEDGVDGVVQQRHHTARIVFTWRCPLVAHGVDRVLSDWHLVPDTKTKESDDNVNADYKKLLSTFVVLQLVRSSDVLLTLDPPSRVRASLSRLLQETAEVRRGQEVVVESTLFGRKFFLNSLSQGVVSNRLGRQGCLMLTDARTGVGCEGGPIFTATRGGKRRLLGLVMATVSWWRGEWVGFTLGVDLRPVLRLVVAERRVASEVLSDGMTCASEAVLGGRFGELNVVLVRCGTRWGSGVVVNASLGLVLTCAHVVNTAGVAVGVVWRGVSRDADVVYRTRDGAAHDVALLRVAAPAAEWRSVAFSVAAPIKGDCVYVVAWPLFSEHVSTSPSITRGIVSHVSPDVMLQTTCCVQSGASGGAVLDSSGKLIGLVSCNARDTATGALYPHVNMIVPTSAFSDPVQEYVRTGDVAVLNKLEVEDEQAQKIWKMNIIISKL